MTFFVSEGWASTFYRWSDPDCFITCDNPVCDRPWVTGSGLMCWALSDDVWVGSLFTDRILIGCDAECLATAQQAKRKCAVWDDRPRPYWISRQPSLNGWMRCVIPSRGILRPHLLGNSYQSGRDRRGFGSYSGACPPPAATAHPSLGPRRVPSLPLLLACPQPGQ
jgi:hypothetical protein